MLCLQEASIEALRTLFYWHFVKNFNNYHYDSVQLYIYVIAYSV